MTERRVGQVRFAADVDAAAHVVVDGLGEIDELGEEMVLDGDTGHHLARVRRLRAGERLTAADGGGRWREFVVTESRRGRLRASATGAVSVEPTLEPALTVAFALVKRDGPERVVERLTELGVDRLVPIVTARAVVRRDETRADATRERMVAIARAAAMQCRRSRLPVVERAVSVHELRHLLPSGTTMVLAARDGTEPAPRAAPGGGWAVVVGPEGGLERSDLEALGPLSRLAVGPHVLRSATACVAAAAVLTRARKWVGKHGASQVGPPV